MISPRCTHGISPMYSWYPRCTEHPLRCTEHPPMYWTPLDVLDIPRCTEHTLYRVIYCFLISYLVLEISMFKESKHDTQNWLTANNNNSQNGDIIRFACWLVSYKIDYNSASTQSNPLKLCEQKVARKI